MRFIIFISAVIIAAAIDLDYCNDIRIGLLIIGIMALSWDILELVYGHR